MDATTLTIGISAELKQFRNVHLLHSVLIALIRRSRCAPFSLLSLGIYTLQWLLSLSFHFLYNLQTVKGGISETRIEKRIVITGDADIDHDQVKTWISASESDHVSKWSVCRHVISQGQIPSPRASWKNPPPKRGVKTLPDLDSLSAFLTSNRHKMWIAVHFPLTPGALLNPNNWEDSWWPLVIHVGLT